MKREVYQRGNPLKQGHNYLKLFTNAWENSRKHLICKYLIVNIAIDEYSPNILTLNFLFNKNEIKFNLIKYLYLLLTY